MKIGERGQVTIPKKYRSRFGLSPATDVEFDEQAGQLVLKKKKKDTHPIGKYVGARKARDERSDDLIEAMRGRCPRQLIPTSCSTFSCPTRFLECARGRR